MFGRQWEQGSVSFELLMYVCATGAKGLSNTAKDEQLRSQMSQKGRSFLPSDFCRTAPELTG